MSRPINEYDLKIFELVCSDFACRTANGAITEVTTDIYKYDLRCEFCNKPLIRKIPFNATPDAEREIIKLEQIILKKIGRERKLK